MQPVALPLWLILSAVGATASTEPTVIRIATFNVEDVRTEELLDPSNPRLRAIAAVIQQIRPNVILLNEVAYDMPGAPGFDPDGPPGRNARRFIDGFLAVAQGPGLQPMRFEAFMEATNTGVPSGLDLDNDGRIVNSFPILNPGQPATPEARAFAGDCWGFGTFPGQYGMALLVDPRLTIQRDRVRTFRKLPWDYMPGAFLPATPEGPWFSEPERAVVRLSSKSHWDVPIVLPDGTIVHILASHPTPPAFDGPEKRNARRNHDEIRFWNDYIENAAYIVDDANLPGGLDEGEHFIIIGDLNADPDEGSSYKDPIGTILFANPRIASDFTPTSEVAIEGLDPDDTARFGLRVDYILPSSSMAVIRGEVWRHGNAPSDHFPVWLEVRVPGG